MQLGIDVSRQSCKSVDNFMGREFDYVIRVCDRAKRQCPVFPGATPIHWGFDDPAEVEGDRQINAFRSVRDEIRQRETIRHTRRAPRYFEYHPAPVRLTQDEVELVVYDFGAVSIILLIAFSIVLPFLTGAGR